MAGMPCQFLLPRVTGAHDVTLLSKAALEDAKPTDKSAPPIGPVGGLNGGLGGCLSHPASPPPPPPPGLRNTPPVMCDIS
jgi:hypothetical protein